MKFDLGFEPSRFKTTEARLYVWTLNEQDASSNQPKRIHHFH